MLSFLRPLLTAAIMLTVLIVAHTGLTTRRSSQDATAPQIAHRIFEHRAIGPSPHKPRPFPRPQAPAPAPAQRPADLVAGIGHSGPAVQEALNPAAHQAVLNTADGSACPNVPGAGDVLLVLLVDAADVKTRYVLSIVAMAFRRQPVLMAADCLRTSTRRSRASTQRCLRPIRAMAARPLT